MTPGGGAGREWDGSLLDSSSRNVWQRCGDSSTQTTHPREMHGVSRMDLPLYTRPTLSWVGSSQKHSLTTTHVKVGLGARPSGTRRHTVAKTTLSIHVHVTTGHKRDSEKLTMRVLEEKAEQTNTVNFDLRYI